MAASTTETPSITSHRVSAPISETSQTLSFETGVLAQQSQGAVVAQIGETVVLATANAETNVREGIDFFPLTVDVEERKAAGAARSEVRVQSVCAIEPDWLLDVEPLGVTESEEMLWDNQRERVEAFGTCHGPAFDHRNGNLTGRLFPARRPRLPASRVRAAR